MGASKLFAWMALASLVSSTATAQVQSSFRSQDPSESVAIEPESTRSRLEELEARAAENDSKIKSLEASAAAAKSKLPSVQLGGVFQADGVAFEQDQASRATYGRIESGADFRRARLGAKGSITDSMDYFMQMDFAFFGRPTFTDLWVDFKEAGPLGTVRVGQWKQPFSLESVSSFRYTTFMERAGVFQAFVPFRHVGVGLFDHSKDERWTWASSYLRTGQDQFGGSLSTDQGNGIASRLTHLAWSNQGGDHYMHLGLGYYLNAPSNGRYRSRSIPEIYVGEYVSPQGEPNGTSGQPVGTIANGTPFMVDTGLLTDVSLVNTYGTEQLWVLGPISWQSELMAQHIDSAAMSNGLLWGGYSQIGYFLTGEHRPYDRKSGTIDRVKPISSVSKSGGIGAWEIALRWSYLDLLDRQIRGGEMENITAGLNWYVNPNCKCVFNYIHCDALARPSKNGIILSDHLTASTTHAFGLRCQVDF